MWLQLLLFWRWRRRSTSCHASFSFPSPLLNNSQLLSRVLSSNVIKKLKFLEFSKPKKNTYKAKTKKSKSWTKVMPLSHPKTKKRNNKIKQWPKFQKASIGVKELGRNLGVWKWKRKKKRVFTAQDPLRFVGHGNIKVN